MFVELVLKVEIKRRNLTNVTVPMISADLHPDKTRLFPFWSVTRIWGENNGKLRSRKLMLIPKINVTLIYASFKILVFPSNKVCIACKGTRIYGCCFASEERNDSRKLSECVRRLTYVTRKVDFLVEVGQETGWTRVT